NRYHFPDGTDVPALSRAGGPGRLLRASGERGPSCLPSVLGAALPGPASRLEVPPEPSPRPHPAALPPGPLGFPSGLAVSFMVDLHTKWAIIETGQGGIRCISGRVRTRWITSPRSSISPKIGR